MSGQIVPYRPATPADKVDALDTVIKAVRPIFEDVYDRAADYPGFIASNEERSPIFAAARSIARLNCRVWARSDKSNYSTRANAGNSELCAPYLESLGENPDGSVVGLPFEGGQCPTTRYLFTWDRYQAGEYVNSGSFDAVGPLAVQVTGFDGPGPAPSCPDGQSYKVILMTNRDAPITLNSGCGVTIRNLTVSPLFGGADDCGDPPVVIQPPATIVTGPPVPPNVTVNLPGSGDVEVSVNINADGDPTICIPIFGVCETIKVNPPSNPGGDGGDGGGGPPPGDVGEPGLPDNTGSGGESGGDAPAGSVLVGLRLDLLTAPSSAKQYAPGVYRAGAYIYMGTPQGLDQDYAGSMLRSSQFVFAERDNLTRWAVRANVGFNWRVTPYYREVT